MMKITSKFLHIPPYLSTNWIYVRSLYLHAETNSLVITLIDGATLGIPGLSPEALDIIFMGHASFLDTYTPTIIQPHQIRSQKTSGIEPPEHLPSNGSIRFDMGGFGSFGSAMQHDPSQSELPDIPEEVLRKVTQVARIVAPDEIQNAPKPEPHCNCPHCQIARAIHQENEIIGTSSEVIKKTLNDDKLLTSQEPVFQQWEIIQAGEKLYDVSNRLDMSEKYIVFLGEPVGCTCGQSGCEHIIAVLNS